jgi:hypothetical protein
MRFTPTPWGCHNVPCDFYLASLEPDEYNRFQLHAQALPLTGLEVEGDPSAQSTLATIPFLYQDSRVNYYVDFFFVKRFLFRRIVKDPCELDHLLTHTDTALTGSLKIASANFSDSIDFIPSSHLLHPFKTFVRTMQRSLPQRLFFIGPNGIVLMALNTLLESKEDLLAKVLVGTIPSYKDELRKFLEQIQEQAWEEYPEHRTQTPLERDMIESLQRRTLMYIQSLLPDPASPPLSQQPSPPLSPALASSSSTDPSPKDAVVDSQSGRKRSRPSTSSSSSSSSSRPPRGRKRRRLDFDTESS